MKEIKYIHEESVHNLASPNEIIPIIKHLIEPKSVIDIGCGIGTFLHVFKKHNVDVVLGIDGSWVNKNTLFKNISPAEFEEKNLEERLQLNYKYDLAVSVEVAEHIHPDFADIFIENLVHAGKVILFSAAMPGQGGQNHLNEQYLSYWKEKFAKHDYIVHDVLKPFFWNNPNIFFWYKQNMVLVTHKNNTSLDHLEHNVLENCVHNEMFTFITKDLEHEIHLFRNGLLPISTYIKYICRALFKRTNTPH